MTATTTSLAGDLAPTGILRASINLGNPVLAQGTAQAPSGVTVDIAREVGARLDLPVELVCFDAARKSLEALTDGRADLCFLAVDPAREDAVVGHVALTGIAPGWEADGWGAGTGLPASALAAVSVLFVDQGTAGRGVGSTLLATAVDHARALERTPVLDVVSESSRAVALYTRHGWQVVGRARPPWLPPDREPLLLMALLSNAPSSDPVDRPVTDGDQPRLRG